MLIARSLDVVWLVEKQKVTRENLVVFAYNFYLACDWWEKKPYGCDIELKKRQHWDISLIKLITNEQMDDRVVLASKDIRLALKLIGNLDKEYNDVYDNLDGQLQSRDAHAPDNMRRMLFIRQNCLGQANYCQKLVDNIHEELTKEIEHLEYRLNNDDFVDSATIPVEHPKMITQEPRYCFCNDISYGEMVACDNPSCVLEWYHLGCVGLKSAPKGTWYCPKCAPIYQARSHRRRNRAS